MNKALPDRTFLSGFMGAGKSTLGKALAKKTGQPFCDLDKKIEQDAGQLIPALFEQEGEEGFRAREQQALLQLIDAPEGIIALGGGTLQSQEVVDMLKASGLLVFIETSIEVVLPRLMQFDNRPLLMDQKGRMKKKAVLERELQHLYQKRMPMYRQAEIILKSPAHQLPHELATQLLKKIQDYAAQH